MSISDYYQIKTLGNVKDYARLPTTGGYVATGVHGPIAAVLPPEKAGYIALHEFFDGEPRGKHYHKVKSEYMLVLSGNLQYQLFMPNKKSIEQEDVETVVLKPGQLIHVSPPLAHIVTAVDGDVQAIEFAQEPYTPDDDIKVSQEILDLVDQVSA